METKETAHKRAEAISRILTVNGIAPSMLYVFAVYTNKKCKPRPECEGKCNMCEFQSLIKHIGHGRLTQADAYALAWALNTEKNNLVRSYA
jgi:hypothetical protein